MARCPREQGARVWGCCGRVNSIDNRSFEQRVRVINGFLHSFCSRGEKIQVCRMGEKGTRKRRNREISEDRRVRKVKKRIYFVSPHARWHGGEMSVMQVRRIKTVLEIQLQAFIVHFIAQLLLAWTLDPTTNALSCPQVKGLHYQNGQSPAQGLISKVLTLKQLGGMFVFRLCVSLEIVSSTVCNKIQPGHVQNVGDWTRRKTDVLFWISSPHIN